MNSGKRKLALLVRHRELGEQQKLLEFSQILSREREAEESLQHATQKLSSLTARQLQARKNNPDIDFAEYHNLLKVSELLDTERRQAELTTRNIETLKRRKSQQLSRAVLERKAVERRQERKHRELEANERTRLMQDNLDQWIAADKEKK